MSVSAKARTEEAAEALCDRIEERYLESRDRLEQRAQTAFFLALGVSVFTVGLMASKGLPLLLAIPLMLLPWTLPWPLLFAADRRAVARARNEARLLIPELAKANQLSAVEVEQALNAAADVRLKLLRSLPPKMLWERPLAGKLVRR